MKDNLPGFAASIIVEVMYIPVHVQMIPFFFVTLTRSQVGDSSVGDIVMFVTLWWWLIWDVGGRIIM